MVSELTFSIDSSLDFLIPNAGITQTGTIETYTEEDIETLLAINLAGVAKTIQAATPILRSQNRGRIVSISSIVGRIGSPLWPVYCGSKWGVIGLAKSAALELGAHNVTSNVICPTVTNTKLVNNEYFLKSVNPENPSMEAIVAFMKTLHAL